MSWRDEDYRINIYSCEDCGKNSTTVDVNEGVTPFMIGCPACKGTARSSMYPKGRPVPDNLYLPTHEWYRPDPKKVARIDRDHVNAGGLLMRPIQTPRDRWRRHSDPPEDGVEELQKENREQEHRSYRKNLEASRLQDKKTLQRRKQAKINKRKGRR